MELTFLNHNYIVRGCDDLSSFELENLEVKNNHIEIIDKNKTGILTSPIINTQEFLKLTGSWSCISDYKKDPKSSIELLIRVRPKNLEFSKYFSYGVWSLYKDNYYYNQDDTDSYMDVDEILLKDNKRGNGFQFKVKLNGSASLSLVCVSMKYENYSYPIKDCNLPSTVVYDVCKLNQNMVPVIGHEMCSATTTTMLLKYKKMNFSKFDSEFEHRYIASLVADPGHNSPTYGNWVYNTAVMGGFGFDSYVCRCYSYDELKYYIAKVGPVGASIKGDTTLYKTNGHLLVIVGYKEIDGKEYILCNDPNINDRFGKDLFVYYEYPKEVFMKIFRGVIYVIE